MEIVTITREGLVLDLLLWRRFGLAGRALVEETLSLNPGLAAKGAVLPLGTIVVLPDPPAAAPKRRRAVVDLFGG